MRKTIEYLAKIPYLIGSLLLGCENKQTSQDNLNDRPEQSTPIKKEFWESEDYKRKLDEAWELAQELRYSGYDFDQHVRSWSKYLGENPTERYIDGRLDRENFHYTDDGLRLAINSFKGQKKRLEEGKTQFPPGRDFITGRFLPEVDPVTGKDLPER